MLDFSSFIAIHINKSLMLLASKDLSKHDIIEIVKNAEGTCL